NEATFCDRYEPATSRGNHSPDVTLDSNQPAEGPRVGGRSAHLAEARGEVGLDAGGGAMSSPWLCSATAHMLCIRLEKFNKVTPWAHCISVVVDTLVRKIQKLGPRTGRWTTDAAPDV